MDTKHDAHIGKKNALWLFMMLAGLKNNEFCLCDLI